MSAVLDQHKIVAVFAMKFGKLGKITFSKKVLRFENDISD